MHTYTPRGPPQYLLQLHASPTNLTCSAVRCVNRATSAPAPSLNYQGAGETLTLGLLVEPGA